MYEVIYNRIISNILLWVPSSPTKQTSVNIGNANPLLNINLTESISIPFSMAKSNIIFGEYLLLFMTLLYKKEHHIKIFAFFHINSTDSSSATNSDSDTDSENIFYSTYHESKLLYTNL